MARWCPRCGAEYVEGFERCSSCDVALQDERPPETDTDVEYTPEDAIFVEPKRARDHDDPFVPIWEGPTPEGSLMAIRLEAAHIPVDRGEAAEAGRLRLEVPRSYIDEAFAVLDATDPHVMDPDVYAEPNGDDPWAEPVGWSRTARYVLVGVAVVLVVLLVLTAL